MQVSRLLFGPLPDLDGKLGFLRKQEPWSHLGSNPLFRMEVRGLTVGGVDGKLFLSYTYILGIWCAWESGGCTATQVLPSTEPAR